MAAARAALPEHSRARRTSGLSLVEMLVVFVLVALLGTLAMQGMAFFSSRYEAVRDRHDEARQAVLRQRWFVASVSGLVPYGLEARRFVGAADAFAGITLAPLNAASGLPVLAQWRIVETANARTLRYAEGEGAGATDWRVLTLAPAPKFQYRDIDQRWHDRWPLRDAPEQLVPTAVRLLQGGSTLWLASVEAHPVSGIVEANLR